MKSEILFLGENSIQGAGQYLAAILQWSKLSFDYLPDNRPVPVSWMRRPYKAIILSDYRYSNWTASARKSLIQRVAGGMGLLMIGGWASFTGLVGGYAGTDIEELLPVRCKRGDDRVQTSQGALLFPASSPPLLCGYHLATVKPGSVVKNVFRDLEVRGQKIRLGTPKPALVIGRFGRGKTAAFLSDCAPHWAGGLVDWGKRRHRIRGSHGDVELGESYLKFFSNLIRTLF